jgi:uncharacterized integral membrane protein
LSAPLGQTPPGTAGKETKAKRRGRRELARSGGWVVLAGLMIAFAVENLNRVKVDWIVGSGRAPLIVVIVISLLVGIVLTHFFGRLARWRRR